MLWQMLLLALGFVVLIKGADWLVSGAATLARKQGAPELTVGLTIVAFGTSAPELVVNTVAAFQGHCRPDHAIERSVEHRLERNTPVISRHPHIFRAGQ
jgi:Ca2+/Na+ antiporter